MKLLLLSLNYTPELTGIGKYNGEMCSEFVARGIETTAISAPPYYPEWEIQPGYSKLTYSKERLSDVEVIRCPLYVPRKPTTLKRILHLMSFAITSGLALFTRVFKKPDVVILVQPTLFCAPLTLLFCKLLGIKSVMHIQDFEVDAMFGLGMMADKKWSWVRKVEAWLTRKFDMVSTISLSMIERAKNKGVDDSRLVYFPNWSNIDFVTPQTCGQSLKQDWGFNKEDKIVLYAGNVGKKQGLEIVLEAASRFDRSPNVHFVIVGAGAHLDELKRMASQMALTNVHFFPLQPWNKVPEMLALASIHLVIQQSGAADAVLPSKLTNILSAGGHGIVTAERHTELGKLEQQYPGIYRCIQPESTDALVLALEQMLNAKHETHNEIARQFAEDHLDKHKIIEAFINSLNPMYDHTV